MTTIDIDKAWNKLHTRLEEENLLANESSKIPIIVKMRQIAAIVLLCILGGTFAIYFGLKKDNLQLVSICNDDISSTLVSTLEDGTFVYLAGGTVLSHPEKFDADKRQVSLLGEAQFNVQSLKSRPFFIDTEIVMVEVTGTEFNVKSTDKNLFELYVLHGSVLVTLKSNKVSLSVESGEMVTLDNGVLIKSLHQKQSNKYTEKMQFKDDYLDNIVRVINTLTDKHIVFADSELKNNRMTVTFNNNTVSEMVELLCATFNLNYSENENEIIICR